MPSVIEPKNRGVLDTPQRKYGPPLQAVDAAHKDEESCQREQTPRKKDEGIHQPARSGLTKCQPLFEDAIESEIGIAV
jgi:hypothetical protein